MRKIEESFIKSATLENLFRCSESVLILFSPEWNLGEYRDIYKCEFLGCNIGSVVFGDNSQGHSMTSNDKTIRETNELKILKPQTS